MSTDGTQPPSIAPRKPAGSSTGVRTTEAPRPRPTPGPAAPPPSSNGASAPETRGPDDGMSMGDRLKRAAAGAAQSARNALPSARDEDDRTEPDPGRDAATAPETAGMAAGGPRRVRLALARIDPWSVMKLAFLLSVAVGIMLIVAAAVVWYTLDGLAVFTSLNATIAEITGSETFFNLLEYVAFDRVISLATMIAIVDVVLLTALSTIGAFLYNIVAALVGGINVTLTDD